MSSSVVEYAGLVAEGVRPVLGDGSAGVLREVLGRLARLDGSLACDADRVDQLGLLEQVKGAAAAAQARVTVEFETSQLAAQDARGGAGQGPGPGDR
jgi:hypothetical protein